MIRLKRFSRGISLTELMVSVGILGLLVSVVGVFLINGIKFSRLSTSRGEIQRDARSCIDLINRSLRQGQAGTVTISRFNGSQPVCSMIEFTDIDNKEHRFYQNSKSFYAGFRNAGEPDWRDSRMAESMRNLFFTYPRMDDDTIVSVSVCFEKATYEGSSKTLQLSVEKIRIMNP